ncbi:MAG: J domain-containing protein [Deltaproteobacteria bacterium]|nr:J domain-containing protein [Deltaproteobacteria bacterium]
MDKKDYYEILGVAKDADLKEIKEAYRNLAFRYHPDRCQDAKDAVEKMKAINEAYAVLSNPDKRKEYDALRGRFGSSAHEHFRRQYTEQDIFKNSDIQRVFEEMANAFGIRGFEEIFKQAYGRNYQHFEFSRPGIYFKGFFFSGWISPWKLGGLSHSPLSHLLKLFFDRFTAMPLPKRGKDLTDTITIHPWHAKQGGPYAYYHRKKGKKLVVQIPPGIKDGQKIRLAGMGEEGSGGAAAGDLYLKVTIKRPLLQGLKGLLGLGQKN